MKIAAPQVLHDVVIRGIQVHGALGISNELPLWRCLQQVFVVGFSDGPAEVHRRSLTRMLLRDAVPSPSVWPSEHIPTRLGMVPDDVRDAGAVVANLEHHVRSSISRRRFCHAVTRLTETRHAGTGALAGLKVVEFAHVIAGPLAGTLLADLGAEVVHVDDPVNGDPGRKMGPPKGDAYLWWKVAARNKRSVTLDLRTAEGQEVARSLVRWADVVITNFRVNTLDEVGPRLGRGTPENPRAVMLQVTGFGATVERATRPVSARSARPAAASSTSRDSRTGRRCTPGSPMPTP